MSPIQILTLDDARAAIRLELSEIRDSSKDCDDNRRVPVGEYLSTQDVLKALRISKATLARWRRDKKIRFSKIGEKLLYLRSDIEELVRSHICLENDSV